MASILVPPGFQDLSDKQVAFARHYIANGHNGTQAAIAAGYAKAGASGTAARLNANPRVKALIASLAADIAEKSSVTPEAVIRELARLGLSDLRKAMRWGTDPDTGEILVQVRDSEDIDDDTAAAISAVKVSDKGHLEIKTHDKVQALSMLARHFGLMEPETVQQTKVTFVIEGGPPLHIDNG